MFQFNHVWNEPENPHMCGMNPKTPVNFTSRGLFNTGENNTLWLQGNFQEDIFTNSIQTTSPQETCSISQLFEIL
jgi:hypothetical protein